MGPKIHAHWSLFNMHINFDPNISWTSVGILGGVLGCGNKGVLLSAESVLDAKDKDAAGDVVGDAVGDAAGDLMEIAAVWLMGVFPLASEELWRLKVNRLTNK